MTIKDSTITKGFIAAGLMNISILISSRFFTNKTIPEFYPEVLSNFGILMIVIWGLAYISVAKNFMHVKWLVAVFAIEKLIYGISWTKWMSNNDIDLVYKKDQMAGTFYSIYGINDWLFFAFFCLVFIYIIRTKKEI